MKLPAAKRPSRSFAKDAASKWLSVADPDVPASVVAEQALKTRLRFVLKQMKRTASRERPTDEDIHQLRVATRRATAALDVFRDFLPRGRRQRLRRQLRAIRQAASSVRDLDIVAIHLREQAALAKETPATSGRGDAGPDKTKKQNQRVQKRLAKRRRVGVCQVAKQVSKRKRQAMRQQGLKLLKRIKWRGDGPEPTLREAATVATHSRSVVFFSAAEKCQTSSSQASPSFPPAPKLHRLRIAAKRLRYSLELLSSVGDESAIAAASCLTEMQQILGVINDHATVRAYYETCASTRGKRHQKRYYRSLSAYEEVRLQEEIESFGEWWSPARQIAIRQHLKGNPSKRDSRASIP